MARKRSTANFISYDLRPAKQSERRILLEVLRTAGDCGLPIREYRYIGMGANRFYDFLLVHKYLGLSKMISLEHDKIMFKRAEFNCPYGFINVQRKSTDSFINKDSFSEPSVIWFDYDGGISASVISDISSLSTKLKLGDFCFVTVFGGPPGALEHENARGRLDWFKEELGDVASNISLTDVENSNFQKAIHKSLSAAFHNAFSYRKDGKFVLLLQVEYSDSKTMITVGGGLIQNALASDLVRRVSQSLPFMNCTNGDLYEIKSLHLTERERFLFDKAATSTYQRCRDKLQLVELGFNDDDFDAYRDLVRFMPRYVETIV